MEDAVVCSACGAVVLRSLQGQHHVFHQHHGHVQTVDFAKGVVLLTPEEAARLAKR